MTYGIANKEKDIEFGYQLIENHSPALVVRKGKTTYYLAYFQSETMAAFLCQKRYRNTGEHKMRLIDADSIKGFALTIILKEATSNLLKGHTKGKNEVIRKSVETFLTIIDGIPTVNEWHYPSKGEYPKEGEMVLLLTNEGVPYLGHFANEYYWETDSFVRTSACIKCWQYIEPPKENA